MSMIASLYTEYHCCWQTRTLCHFLPGDSGWKSSHRENEGISWYSGENWQRGVLQDFKSLIAFHCHVKFFTGITVSIVFKKKKEKKKKRNNWYLGEKEGLNIQQGFKKSYLGQVYFCCWAFL